MSHNKIHLHGAATVLLIALEFILIQTFIYAQSNQVQKDYKILLIDSIGQSEQFYKRLQEKISQFEMISVYLKNDLRKELPQNEQSALDKCSALSCLQNLSSKVDIEKIFLCSIERQGNVYRFRCSEYGVKNTLILSEITEEEIFKSSSEINNYITTIAIDIGQKTIGTDYIPVALQPSSSNLLYYGAGAAIVVGTGIYLLTKGSQENESVVDKTLPLAPDLP